MKKILIAATLIFSVASCTNDFEKMNVNPKQATVVPGQTLFSSSQKSLADVLTSANVNTNIFRLLAQYWAQTTYTDESRYDLNTRNISQNFWNVMYRDVLRDLQESERLISADENLDAKVKQNQLAIIQINQVYAWVKLVDTFGNIPYFEALDVDNPYPVYDDASAIYDDLFTRLDAALGNLDPSAKSFGDADLIYGGDVSNWVKFGNSLKLKMGMTLADVNPGKAKAAVEAAAPNVFQSNADNAVFNYLAAPPNTNPIWVDLIQSGRKDFVIANTLINRMNSLNDPRRDPYFTTVNDAYVGGVYGASNNFNAFSKPDEAITDPSFPGDLMDYAEVEFFLAEAAARGYSVPGTAPENFVDGITASMEYWNVPQAQITAYLAQPSIVADIATLTANPSNFRQPIGVQKWIALYNRGHEAWTEWRRLDYPQLQAPENALLPSIPTRYPYPVLEQTLNSANYKAAASAIGQDVATNKVFWDVN